MEASNPSASPKRSWKSLLLMGAGFGAGAVVMAAAIIGIFAWYVNRPKEWDTKTIVVSGPVHFSEPGWFSAASQKTPDALSTSSSKIIPPPTPTTGDDWVLEQGGEVDMVFDLQNNGRRDYTLSKDVSIMRKIQRTSSLTNSNGTTLPSDYFIPAGEKAEINVTTNVYCALTIKEWDSCVVEDSNGRGFVFFDHANHIEITVPLPGQQSAKSKR